eukprot:1441125-Rhodomonas_salina.3
MVSNFVSAWKEGHCIDNDGQPPTADSLRAARRREADASGLRQYSGHSSGLRGNSSGLERTAWEEAHQNVQPRASKPRNYRPAGLTCTAVRGEVHFGLSRNALSSYRSAVFVLRPVRFRPALRFESW